MARVAGEGGEGGRGLERRNHLTASATPGCCVYRTWSQPLTQGINRVSISLYQLGRRASRVSNMSSTSCASILAHARCHSRLPPGFVCVGHAASDVLRG